MGPVKKEMRFNFLHISCLPRRINKNIYHSFWNKTIAGIAFRWTFDDWNSHKLSSLLCYHTCNRNLQVLFRVPLQENGLSWKVLGNLRHIIWDIYRSKIIKMINLNKCSHGVWSEPLFLLSLTKGNASLYYDCPLLQNLAHPWATDAHKWPNI